ncbi:hypothetical protein HMPREF3038_00686 [Akkermansia sp. KLE1797]|nr:hypothetical protein HMPREF3038_00686 [Akkermansia sp. KLE1797]KXU54230.1 hypothetical protein HMPREF3039_01558 [Akkermansia sp. KLE1798]KZA04584.1 hypothetical protein HMPREF1326_01638 [Akkermansia sp. KLE1605]
MHGRENGYRFRRGRAGQGNGTEMLTEKASFSILFYRCRRCFVLRRFLLTGACLCMGIKCLSVCFS